MDSVPQQQLARLFEALGDARTLVILPHNDPDPDAIASAVALRALLAKARGVESQLAYKGIIGRVENKALVRYLDRPLRRLKGSDLKASVPIALVDTQPGAGNNALPRGARATLVFDHHPRREATAPATFVEIRPDVGATSTILTEYLQAAGIEPDPQLATALFYGIKTDTMGLARGTSPADVAAYFYLQPRIDVEALVQIENAQVPPEYFQKMVTALQAARLYDGVLVSYLGEMHRPDLAAEMADVLLRLEGAQWVVCMGVYEREFILNVRTRNRKGGAGYLVQAIVGEQGTAGGHGMMAAGHVPLRGQNPEHLAAQFAWRMLHYLHVPVGGTGRPLLGDGPPVQQKRGDWVAPPDS
jgi:nanoRNase/pAp phosphatase (c-di-AMP/oligoRNAs hydrolase)